MKLTPVILRLSETITIRGYLLQNAELQIKIEDICKCLKCHRHFLNQIFGTYFHINPIVTIKIESTLTSTINYNAFVHLVRYANSQGNATAEIIETNVWQNRKSWKPLVVNHPHKLHQESL